MGGGGASCRPVFQGRISFSLETLSGLLTSAPLPQLSFLEQRGWAGEETLPRPPDMGTL